MDRPGVLIIFALARARPSSCVLMYQLSTADLQCCGAVVRAEGKGATLCHSRAQHSRLGLV
eukprot:3755415-Alexandrium_andersonii.AAC.1